MSNQNAHFELIWKNALVDYESVTGKKLDDPQLSKLNTVDDLMQSLDSDDKRFQKYRQTNRTFFTVLSEALRPIELVSNSAAGGVSTVFPPSSLIFGAVTYLINAAKGVSKAYDAIEELFVSLKDFTARLHVYTREIVSKELQAKLVQILTATLSVLALSQKAIKRGRKWQFGQIVLLGGDEKINDAVALLDKLTQNESRLVGAETLTESKRLGRTLDLAVQNHGTMLSNVNSNVKEIRRDFGNFAQTMDGMRNNVAEAKDQKLREKLYEILRPSVSAHDTYEHICKKRVTGTGDWIRDERTFQSWVHRDIPLLWVTGNPGAGKSFLAASIISFLREHIALSDQATTSASVSYYFFKDTSPETRSFNQALRDLAYQICQNDLVYAKYIASSCHSHDDVKTIGSAWRTLYVGFFVRGGDIDKPVYLILDGIDEAFDADRESFFELLGDLKKSRQPAQIQLVLVGRPQLSDELCEAFQEYLPTIHVNGDKTSDDIVLYIQTSIQKSKTMKLISQEFKSQIVETLSTKAQGMFIWVDLMLQELYKKTRPSAILDALDKAPRGLNDMLKHVLETFSATLQKEDAEDLNELLMWVTCAQRPLTLGELDTILSLKSAQGDGLLSLESSLRTQFAAFFILTREDELTTAEIQHISAHASRTRPYAEDDNGGEQGLDYVYSTTPFNSDPSTTEVTFCHASIGEFLRDQCESQVSAREGSPILGVDFNQAKALICRKCLSLLCGWETGGRKETGVDLKSYAAFCWLFHLREVDQSKTNIEDKKAIGTSLIRMFKDEEVIPSWSGGVVGVSFYNNENLSLIRSWLDDPEVTVALSVGDCDWVTETAKVPASTFMAEARYTATQWLKGVEEDWDPEGCFQSLYAFLELERGVSVDIDSLEVPTASDIMRVAEWAGFEKNALWHRQVALVMQEYNLCDAAIDCYEESLALETLELESTSWIARGGLSMVCVLQKDWKKAIELDEFNEDLILKRLKVGLKEEDTSLKEQLHTIQERMAKCYRKLHDRQNALRCFQAGFESKKDCYHCAKQCASEFMRAERYADFMGLLCGMRENLPGKKHTRLDELFWDNGWYNRYRGLCNFAAQATNSLRVLVDMYLNNIIAAKRESNIQNAVLSEIELAGVYYYLDEFDKALYILQSQFQTSEAAAKPANSESLVGYWRWWLHESIAMLYFQRHLDAPQGSSQQSADILSLEQLAGAKKNATNETRDVVSTNRAGIYLGNWYRLNGRVHESHACFKAYIRDIVRSLGNDPKGDDERFRQLVSVLLAERHDAKAIAVVQARYYVDKDSTGRCALDNTCKKTEMGIEDSDSESEGSDQDSEEALCNGICRKRRGRISPLAMCRYCIDTVFCQECLELLKDGSRFGWCAADHEWLYVPAPTHKHDEGTYVVDGEVISIADFYAQLRKEWDV